MMEANLKAMIAMGREAGSRVVLLGMKIPPNYGRAYTQAFENVFTQLGKSGQVTLVPFFLEGIGGRTELMQADGIHPNARAQARLLENAWPAVKKALR
jgi:acyl-CoA thioesterase-1